MINEWTVELERRSRAFVKHAEELSKWDRSILENRKSLIKLEEELKRVLAGQDALERRLQMVEAHQKGIHEALNGMSTEAERIHREEQGLADDQAVERDVLYQRTSRLGTVLGQIEEQLTEAIQDVNSVTAANLGDGSGSIGKLVRVMNNQLNALIQLESKTNEVAEELGKVQQQQ
jgi:nuclear pore complex protein Nup62